MQGRRERRLQKFLMSPGGTPGHRVRGGRGEGEGGRGGGEGGREGTGGGAAS